MRITKRYEIFGFFCLLLGPVIAAAAQKTGHILGILFIVLGAISVLVGNRWLEKSKEIIRELAIKSRLDGDSLRVLMKLNGLMFTREELKEKFKIEASIETIRYLIRQDVIKNEVFSLSPDDNISYGYCLTDFGKEVLRKHIGVVNLFPDIIIDMYRVAYWLGHKNDFPVKKQDFRSIHKKEFDNCIGSFFLLIPSKSTESQNSSYENKIDTFRSFLEDQSLSYDDKMKTIRIWLQEF